MAERRPSRAVHGFSMVEMLVAMVFTGLLMAGMSQVFKASLSSFYTSGEVLSSARRNRASLDMLQDDLNAAGLYLTSITVPPPGISADNPPFYIMPNMVVDGAGADDPSSADQLFFYQDMPLPFEGALSAATAARSAAEVIAAGGTLAGDDSVFIVDCGDPSYAKMIKAGMAFVLKDAWETLQIGSVSVSGKVATVTAAATPTAGISGQGYSGLPSRAKHNTGAAVLFYAPAQMVRYSLQMRALDPQIPAGIPCLVREQGTYSAAGFVAAGQASVITENAAGFKVYLSADSGTTWAGMAKSYTGFAAGWSNGIRADLNTQLATSGRAGQQTTVGNEHWFRSIPTLVRIDVTTRTAVKRAEHSATGTAAAFRNLRQTLVVVPRHSGLPLS